jgi:hypothetical protein
MFAAVGAWFMKLILGGGLAGIGKIAVDLYSKKLDAEGSTQNVVASVTAKEIELSQREAELNAQIVIAEQGNWVTRWVRPLWAFPFVAWTFKAVFIDKVVCPPLGWHCSTDPLTGMVATLCITIAGCYFGGRSVETVARIIADTRRGLTAK